MAYTSNTFNQTSSGKNTQSMTDYSYLSDDSADTIGAVGYFDEKAIAFRLNDIIGVMAPAETGVQKFHRRRVSNIDTSGAPFPGIISTSLDRRLVFFDQFIPPGFFVPASADRVDFYPPTEVINVTGYKPIRIDFYFTGDIPGVETLALGLNGASTQFLVLTNTQLLIRNSVTLDLIADLNDTDSLSLTKDVNANPGIESFHAKWVLEPIF